MKNYIALQEQLKLMNIKVCLIIISHISCFYVINVSNLYDFDQLLKLQEIILNLETFKTQNVQTKDNDISLNFAYRSATREVSLNIKVSINCFLFLLNSLTGHIDLMWPGCHDYTTQLNPVIHILYLYISMDYFKGTFL